MMPTRVPPSTADLPTNAPRVRLYLDVDGPIAPYVEPGVVPTGWPDYREGFVGRRLATHSPSMLATIARLDVEVVWCTTWGEQAEASFGPLLGAGTRRTLELAAVPLAPGGVKGAAVFADLERDPAPAIWVDDDAITAVASARLQTLPRPILLLAPDRTSGLEPRHLGEMVDFLRRYGRGSAPPGR